MALFYDCETNKKIENPITCNLHCSRPLSTTTDRFFKEISQLRMSRFVKIPKNQKKAQQEAKKIFNQQKALIPSQKATQFFFSHGAVFKCTVLAFFDIQDLAVISMVCPKFNLLANDLSVLQRLARRVCPDAFAIMEPLALALTLRSSYQAQSKAVSTEKKAVCNVGSDIFSFLLKHYGKIACEKQHKKTARKALLAIWEVRGYIPRQCENHLHCPERWVQWDKTNSWGSYSPFVVYPGFYN